MTPQRQDLVSVLSKEKVAEISGLKTLTGHLTSINGPVDNIYYVGCKECFSKLNIEIDQFLF